VIRGIQDAVHQAELMVRKIIVDQPPIVNDTVSVPGNSVGRIIGQFCSACLHCGSMGTMCKVVRYLSSLVGCQIRG